MILHEPAIWFAAGYLTGGFVACLLACLLAWLNVWNQATAEQESTGDCNGSGEFERGEKR